MLFYGYMWDNKLSKGVTHFIEYAKDPKSENCWCEPLGYLNPLIMLPIVLLIGLPIGLTIELPMRYRNTHKKPGLPIHLAFPNGWVHQFVTLAELTLYKW